MAPAPRAVRVCRAVCENAVFKALLDSCLVRNRCRAADGNVAIEPNGDTHKRFVYATSEQPQGVGRET